MVEQDTIAGKQVISLAVITRHPIGIYFGGRVRAARLKRGVFVLGRFGPAVHFAGRGLIEAALDPALAHRFKNADGAHAGYIAGIFGHIETHAHMALRGQVVDFIRADIVDDV